MLLFSTRRSGLCRSRKSWIGLATLILTTSLGLAAAPPAAVAADSVVDLSALEGDWRLVDQDAARVHRERAIETAVKDLNWVLRKMATPRLVKSIVPPKRLHFFRKGNQLRQRVVEGETTLERPVTLGSGTVHSQTGEGEPFEAAWSLADSGLRLDWKQHQAYGSNLYRVDPTTGSLVVEQVIQLTAIDDVAPIVFESRFARRAMPQVAAQADTEER